MNISRRRLLAVLGAAPLIMHPLARALAGDMPASLRGTNPVWIPANAPLSQVPTNLPIQGRVVVIGGGMAGATVAKYIRLWGGSGLQVTLVERERTYVSNIMSNLVLSNALAIESLNFDWKALVDRYGVKLVTGEVTAIDPAGKRVTVDGSSIPYDRLVVAPGIEFDPVPGLETAAAQNSVPHAWKAGAQTTDLRKQIAAMPSGGVFLMSVPKAPYRCPPGPYERACIVADHVKRANPRSKVIVLDENPAITVEKELFTHAFSVTHAGVIDYRPGVGVQSVDAAAGVVRTSSGEMVKANVLNVIPSQRAGAILAASGLTNSADGRWSVVDELTYESTAAESIHVLGDSAATLQPKAGHIANQEAKVCADAMVRSFLGLALDPAPVTNSACYSPITANTASWMTALYAYDPTSKRMKPIPDGVGEGPANARNMEEMRQWFSNLMTDSYA